MTHRESSVVHVLEAGGRASGQVYDLGNAGFMLTLLVSKNVFWESLSALLLSSKRASELVVKLTAFDKVQVNTHLVTWSSK